MLINKYLQVDSTVKDFLNINSMKLCNRFNENMLDGDQRGHLCVM